MPPLRRFAATCLIALAAFAPATPAVAGPASPAPAAAPDEAALSDRAAKAAARAWPSVVAIRAFGPGSEGYGAGVVVRAEGHVLTAHHVVEKATALAVTLPDGEQLPARLVGKDPAVDLALLEILAPGRTFATATLGGDDGLRLGETVLAISNPFGIGTSVSRGVVSAMDRRGVVKDNAAPLLQTDAAINPGSSGGALLDLDGRVVGLITAILTRTGGHQGVGFAVPARELVRALPHLAEGRPVPRPWLGLRVAPAPTSRAGLVVRAVVPGGPAASAGLRAGDRLVELHGAPLRRIDDLKDLLQRSAVGQSVPLGVERAGKRIEVDVEVGTREPSRPAEKPANLADSPVPGGGP